MADPIFSQSEPSDAYHKDDDDLDTLYEGVMNCEPAIPPADMERVADLVRDNARIGRSWRLTALLASKDGAFYRGVADDAELAQAFAATIGPLQDFAKTLRTVADLADTAHARILVAGCNHEHFNDWVTAAHADSGESSHA